MSHEKTVLCLVCRGPVTLKDSGKVAEIFPEMGYYAVIQRITECPTCGTRRLCSMEIRVRDLGETEQSYVAGKMSREKYLGRKCPSKDTKGS